MPAISLDAADAIELAELLQLIDDWLQSDPGNLTASLTRFTGSPAYGPAELRSDVARFRFLLGITDGEGSSARANSNAGYIWSRGSASISRMACGRHSLTALRPFCQGGYLLPRQATSPQWWSFGGLTETLSGCLDTKWLSGHPDSMSADDSPAAALAGQVTNKDPAIGLHAVVALRRLLEELERLHVDSARELGWTWQSIAAALQVSRQSVHEKHATRRKLAGKED